MAVKESPKPGQPTIPAGLWMLWNKPTEPGGDDGFWVVAIDGATDVLMAFDNPRNASHEAARQNDLYDLDCMAVRVK